MSAKAFDDAWAQVQGDDAADPAITSLVRTALAKRIIETRGMASVVNPPFRRPNYACQVGAAGALVGEPRGPRLQVALTPLFANKLLIRTAEGTIRLRAWISSPTPTRRSTLILMCVIRLVCRPRA
jgi:hypothetical protein